MTDTNIEVIEHLDFDHAPACEATNPIVEDYCQGENKAEYYVEYSYPILHVTKHTYLCTGCRTVWLALIKTFGEDVVTISKDIKL